MNQEITDLILGLSQSVEETQNLLSILENPATPSEQISLVLAIFADRFSGTSRMADEERTRLNRVLSHLLSRADNNFLKHSENRYV
ncbi:hypothetical protein SAMN05444167_0665 [Terriglobus roseus]|uniref:Uncharacterized protein n=1 Tax=Terriglobus roseus TaxID=392734 RepID=A0A1G7GEC2_9BACT|nr:hypothetical protein SAMN05444167_0665 [Terriglobus roseus]